MSKNYKEIFWKIENSLRDNMKKFGHDMDVEFKDAKELTFSPKSDDWYFNVLKMIPFYSNFSAKTVKSKQSVIDGYFDDFRKVAKYTDKDVAKMMKDENMIKKEVKIQSVIKNAKRFNEIVKEYGSIHKFFESFNPTESQENLLKMAKQIRSPFFSFLGVVTVNHFLTEIGLDVLKPDRVVQRVYHRLNLIENLNDYEKSIEIGRKMAQETKLPIRYIDIVLVVYGQIEDYAICTEKNPKCSLCGAYDLCKYEHKSKK